MPRGRYDAGTYTPYNEEALSEVLATAKRQVHPWIRLNRVVRDIPSQYVLGGVDAPNLRQDVLTLMTNRGERCRCIRCREVGNETTPPPSLPPLATRGMLPWRHVA